MGTVSWTRGDGPLVSFADGFRQQLLGVGHTPGAARHHLGLMGQLNSWLRAERLGVGELTPAVAQQFLDTRRVRADGRGPTLAKLAPLFRDPTRQGALPAAQPSAAA